MILHNVPLEGVLGHSYAPALSWLTKTGGFDIGKPGDEPTRMTPAAMAYSPHSMLLLSSCTWLILDPDVIFQRCTSNPGLIFIETVG